MSSIIFYKNKDELQNKLQYVESGKVYFVEAPYEEPFVLKSGEYDMFDITSLSETSLQCLMKVIATNLGGYNIIYESNNDYEITILNTDDPLKIISNMISAANGEDTHFYLSSDNLEDIDADYIYDDRYAGTFGSIEYDNGTQTINLCGELLYLLQSASLSEYPDVPVSVNFNGKDVFFIKSEDYLHKINRFYGSKYIISNSENAKYCYRTAYYDYMYQASIGDPVIKDAINTILTTSSTNRISTVWLQTDDTTKCLGLSKDITYDDIIAAVMNFEPTLSNYISVKLKSCHLYKKHADISEIAKIYNNVFISEHNKLYIEVDMDCLPTIM